MRGFLFRSTVAALVLLALLAAWQSQRLAEKRRSSLPEAYAGYTADAPPALTFVIAGLGGFRGIVAETLWFRADRLQEEGRYMELVQLADWITMLDPHAAEAWVYNAWNLAYNISIMMVRPEDRLRWVQNGVALLRDQGLRFNPREARLYRELAWLYQNKFGDELDSAHLTYKIALAQTMAPLLQADGTVRASAENREAFRALRLDPDRMLDLERRFGPLDWRMPETHAVYWADQGVALSSGTERLLCRRGVYQPLILSVLRGRFDGSIEEKRWSTKPNPELAAAVADYMLQTLREYPSWNMTVVTLRFLALAVQVAERAGRHECAQTVYRQLLSSLPAALEKPAFETVMKGWVPPDEEP